MKRFLSILLALMLTVSLCGITSEAAPTTINAWIAMPDNSAVLNIGTTYYVIDTRLATGVFFTQPAYGAIQMTTDNVQSIYSAIPGSGYGGNVIINGPGFDGCPNGALVDYDGINGWKYYCDGGGVTNLQVYVYSSLQQVTLTDQDLALTPKKPYYVAGEALSSSDFTLEVTYGGSTYTLDESQYTISGNAAVAGTENVTATMQGLTADCNIDVRSKVSYQANGGTVTGANDVYVAAGQSTVLPAAVNGNYELAGWYTSATTGTLVGLAGATYVPITSVNLHAQWRNAAPQASVDYVDGKLTGLTAGEQYDINGVVYVADTNGTVAMQSDWYGDSISIVHVGVGQIHDSNAQTLTLLAQNTDIPAAPTVVKTTAYVIAVAAENGQEYSIDGGLTWVSAATGANEVVFENLTKDTEYNIITRYAQTSTHLASDNSQPATARTRRYTAVEIADMFGTNSIGNGQTGLGEEASNSKVVVTVDSDGDYVVTLRDDIAGTVTIPDDMLGLVINLSGNTIKGNDGTAVHPAGADGLVIASSGASDDSTLLYIIDSVGGGVIAGGDAYVNSGANGGSGINASGAGTGTGIGVGIGTSVIGGNGAANTTAGGNGGSGGSGVVTGGSQLIVAGGSVSGGNGGAGGDSGHGGNGGSGVNGNASFSSGSASGGIGGAGGSSQNGNGGNGGNGGHTVSGATSGSNLGTGGNAGNGGSSVNGNGGIGGNGGNATAGIAGIGGVGGNSVNGAGGAGGNGGTATTGTPGAGGNGGISTNSTGGQGGIGGTNSAGVKAANGMNGAGAVKQPAATTGKSQGVPNTGDNSLTAVLWTTVLAAAIICMLLAVVKRRQAK